MLLTNGRSRLRTLALALLLCACQMINPPPETEEADATLAAMLSAQPFATQVQGTESARQVLEVTLQVDAPFSHAQLQITSNGWIAYQASSPETGVDSQEGQKQLSPEAWGRLEQAILSLDFQSLDAYYADETLMDASTVTLLVSIQTDSGQVQQYRVACYASCPEQVRAVMALIRQLWGMEILEVGV